MIGDKIEDAIKNYISTNSQLNESKTVALWRLDYCPHTHTHTHKNTHKLQRGNFISLLASRWTWYLLLSEHKVLSDLSHTAGWKKRAHGAGSNTHEHSYTHSVMHTACA